MAATSSKTKVSGYLRRGTNARHLELSAVHPRIRNQIPARVAAPCGCESNHVGVEPAPLKLKLPLVWRMEVVGTVRDYFLPMYITKSDGCIQRPRLPLGFQQKKGQLLFQDRNVGDRMALFVTGTACFLPGEELPTRRELHVLEQLSSGTRRL